MLSDTLGFGMPMALSRWEKVGQGGDAASSHTCRARAGNVISSMLARIRSLPPVAFLCAHTHARPYEQAYGSEPGARANAIMRSFEAMMHEVPKRSANPLRRYAIWDAVRGLWREGRGLGGLGGGR